MSNPMNASILLAAAALSEARTTRRTIAPISSSFGITGLAATYTVAEHNTRLRVQQGRRITGLKVGLTPWCQCPKVTWCGPNWARWAVSAVASLPRSLGGRPHQPGSSHSIAAMPVSQGTTGS